MNRTNPNPPGLANTVVSVLVVTLLQAPMSALARDGWRASVGLDYSTGDYRNEVSTDIWSLAAKLRYKTGRWRWEGRLPYLRITGPDNVIASEGIPIDDVAGVRRTRRGVGDVTLSATYRALYDRDTGFGLSLRGKVKLPTADEAKRLGTGETDLYLELKPFYVRGSATWFGTAGYKIYGDPPAIDYRNVWYGTLGGMWRHSQQLSVGAMLSGRQKVTATSDTRRTVMAFATRSLAADTRLQAYLLKGFGESSPDWGGGLMLQRDF